ncbi:MAG: hypothetical protein AB7F88_18290 [Pyrinomonadaceae bacterium]
MSNRKGGSTTDNHYRENEVKGGPDGVREDQHQQQTNRPSFSLGERKRICAVCQMNERVTDDVVDLESQLIIATHSPILMAYPDALIYNFSEDGIMPINYTETEHYAITKEFLNKPERMLSILFDETDAD